MTDLERLEALLAQAEARVEDLRIAVRVMRELKGVAVEPQPLLTIRRVGPPPAAEPAKVNGAGKVKRKSPTTQNGTPRLSKPEGAIVRKKILDVVNQHPEGIKTQDVGQALGLTTQQSGQFLNRMRLAGEIIRVDAGFFKPMQ